MQGHVVQGQRSLLRVMSSAGPAASTRPRPKLLQCKDTASQVKNCISSCFLVFSILSSTGRLKATLRPYRPSSPFHFALLLPRPTRPVGAAAPVRRGARRWDQSHRKPIARKSRGSAPAGRAAVVVVPRMWASTISKVDCTCWLVHKDHVKQISEIILPLQGRKVVDLCVSTVVTRGKDVTMWLNLEQPGQACPRHSQFLDLGATLIALWTAKCF